MITNDKHILRPAVSKKQNAKNRWTTVMMGGVPDSKDRVSTNENQRATFAVIDNLLNGPTALSCALGSSCFVPFAFLSALRSTMLAVGRFNMPALIANSLDGIAGARGYAWFIIFHFEPSLCIARSILRLVFCKRFATDSFSSSAHTHKAIVCAGLLHLCRFFNPMLVPSDLCSAFAAFPSWRQRRQY